MSIYNSCWYILYFCGSVGIIYVGYLIELSFASNDSWYLENRNWITCALLHTTFEVSKWHWALLKLDGGLCVRVCVCTGVRVCDPGRQLIVEHILSGLTGHCQVQLPLLSHPHWYRVPHTEIYLHQYANVIWWEELLKLWTCHNNAKESWFTPPSLCNFSIFAHWHSWVIQFNSKC